MKIAIISASIRKGRQTHAVALELQRRLQQRDGLISDLIDLGEVTLPLFEETYQEESASPATTALRKRLRAADALFFVSPEYNGSYTAALKNMTDGFSKVEFAGKPIGVVSVSSGILGGMRAAQLMQQLVLALYGFPIPQLLLVPEVSKKFSEEGALLDAAFGQKIEDYLDKYLWFAQAISNQKEKEKALVAR